MGSRHFPHIAFGQCARCGRRAADNGGTSADVSPTYTSKRDLELVYFRGEWWCPICKEDELSDEHSERVADYSAREDAFRSAAGFVNSVAQE